MSWPADAPEGSRGGVGGGCCPREGKRGLTRELLRERKVGRVSGKKGECGRMGKVTEGDAGVASWWEGR